MLRAPQPDILTKGGGLVLDVIKRSAAGRVEALLPSGSAAPGDALRFRLSTSQPGFAAIISIDGAGAITTYYPEGRELAPIARGSRQLLDNGIELDATLGKERLLALVCRRQRPVDEVREAVRAELTRAGDAARVDPARALPDCTATSFWFEKVPSR
jgi:hypothetical protein